MDNFDNDLLKPKKLKEKIKIYFDGMSKERKSVVTIVGSIITVMIIIFISFGFNTRNDVLLLGHSVSPNGTAIGMTVTVASSSGYTRGYRIRERGENCYITFYSTFGKLPIGGKKYFNVKVNPKCQNIYFNRIGRNYELVLMKDSETNIWKEIKK